MSQKYNAPEGPPPTYPPQVHHDAGPYNPPNQPGSPFQGDPRGNQNNNFYGSPAPQGQYGPPAQYGNYGPPQQYNQGYGGPPPEGGFYGQPQQMQYGPPGPGYGYQPQGYYVDRGGGRGGAGEGLCAGLMAALACCCCIDFLI